MAKFLKTKRLINVERAVDYNESYSWKEYLCSFKIIDNDDVDNESVFLVDAAVPVTALAKDETNELICQFGQGSHILNFVCVPVNDYKERCGGHVRPFWPAKVLKIAGLRALFRWVGATAEDSEFDFWANVYSPDIRGITNAGYRALINWSFNGIDTFQAACYISKNSSVTETYIPPKFLEERWKHNTFLAQLEELNLSKHCLTIGDFFQHDREVITKPTKLKVGQRLELLDNIVSTRLRPARIINIKGRRLCLRVMPNECDDEDEDDIQYGSKNNFWADHESFFLFPVGWAMLNNYQLSAKSDYKRHTRRIREAILQGKKPNYDLDDVRPDYLPAFKNRDDNLAGWKKGMKLEMLDPLGASIRQLTVATVLDMYHKSGYLLIGLDGPDTHKDVVPLHHKSPFLFHIGYAEANGIELKIPEGMENFKWNTYLQLEKAIAAPPHFFKNDPTPSRLSQIKVGAKVEACDMCDNQMICPATIISIRGRLLHIRFDGWDETYDQYYDIDSKDIFPMGWCEINGYMLQHPKN